MRDAPRVEKVELEEWAELDALGEADARRLAGVGSRIAELQALSSPRARQFYLARPRAALAKDAQLLTALRQLLGQVRARPHPTPPQHRRIQSQWTTATTRSVYSISERIFSQGYAKSDCAGDTAVLCGGG